jgi:hypothetical protein
MEDYMNVPKGFMPCSVSGEYVEGCWEIAFAFGDEGDRTIKLRLGLKDIDQLSQVVAAGSRVLKHEQLVQGQERLLTKRRKRAIFHLG